MKTGRQRLLASIPLISISWLVFADIGQASERLEVAVIAAGNRHQAVQELDFAFKDYHSGVLPNQDTGVPIRDYQAIRCNGPWGAMKYKLPLASGPGFELRAEGDTLLLQIVEHSVISEDNAINKMDIHCLDLEPRPVVKSVIEIELQRGAEAFQKIQLANGYLLEFHYSP